MNYIKVENKYLIPDIDSIQNASINDIITYLYEIQYVKKVITQYRNAGKINTILSDEDIEQEIYILLIKKGSELIEKLKVDPNLFFGYVKSIIGRQLTMPRSRINWKYREIKENEVLFDMNQLFMN